MDNGEVMCEHYEWFKHNYIMGECRGRVYLRTERRQNIFEKDGEDKAQIVAYDFYNVKEDLYYDYGRKA